MEDQIPVICPRCNRSSVVSFVAKEEEISVDQDNCPYCRTDWLLDIIEQIEVELEDLPRYDCDDLEEIQQEEFNQVLSRLTGTN